MSGAVSRDILAPRARRAIMNELADSGPTVSASISGKVMFAFMYDRIILLFVTHTQNIPFGLKAMSSFYKIFTETLLSGFLTFREAFFNTSARKMQLDVGNEPYLSQQ